MMQEERKEIIRYSLGFNVDNINTYSGYKGDLIVKITTKDRETLGEIRKFALSLGIKEVVIKQNQSLSIYEIYCVTADKDVYLIKQDEVLEDIHTKHPVDPWERSSLK